MEEPVATTPWMIGGKYRVLRTLGQGSYGIVYEAQNTWTGRRVAVKTLRRRAGTDALVARRFEQEARAAAALRHPNIVDVLDLGEDPEDGSLYIVQALLRGKTLKATLGEVGRLRPRDAVELLVPLLGALVAIHRAGMLHRDLKPGNIDLASEQARRVCPTLIDFGLSKFVDESLTAVRKETGLTLGTPTCMSPEQARGERDLVDGNGRGRRSKVARRSGAIHGGPLGGRPCHRLTRRSPRLYPVG
jgi:serine/threonine-protein kinase